MQLNTPFSVASESLARFQNLFASALRRTLREGYTRQKLKSDLMAGAVVGVVALPLSMALAIASGVAPQHGLYTAIVAGALTAVTGGSNVNVTGPTAAFVVILAPISERFGLGGLLVATALAGLILLILGGARLGQLITFIPHPVTTGFTAGIAVVIAVLQVRDFLGLQVDLSGESFEERVVAIVRALPTFRWEDTAIGLFTLAVLMLWPRISKRVPAPLVALVSATVAAEMLTRFLVGFDSTTIASRFSEIPSTPLQLALPWNFPGPAGRPLELSFHLVRELMPSAFAIAMLGAIESLLCAVVADGMTGTQHDPDSELIGQGLGNLVAPFFGGIAATGAIARTATSIRAGAVSPFAAVFHSAFVMLAMLLLAPVLGHLPMAALAALLMLVAWNMSEAKHFVRTVRIAPRSDTAVLLTCFLLTVVFDMVVSVTVGVVLAALLFMRRMALVANVRLVAGNAGDAKHDLPSGYWLYEIAGPLFFGAAQKAMSTLRVVAPGTRHVLLDMHSVPVMDATGLVNLQSALSRLRAANVDVTLIGVQPQPLDLLQRADVLGGKNAPRIHATIDEAIRASRTGEHP